MLCLQCPVTLKLNVGHQHTLIDGNLYCVYPLGPLALVCPFVDLKVISLSTFWYVLKLNHFFHFFSLLEFLFFFLT